MRKIMINFLFSQNNSRDGEQRKSADNHDCHAINFSSKGDMLERSTSKFIETSSRQESRYSRMSSRRFSRSHVMKIRNIHSFEFIRMNGSGVISSRSGCGPSIDFLRTDQEIHGVPRFNRVNIAPTNREFSKWVSDNNSLVEQSYFWSQKQQESDITEKKIYNQGCHFGFEITFVEKRNSNSEAKDKNANTVNEITSRTKNFYISHDQIFSWKVERSAA